MRFNETSKKFLKDRRAVFGLTSVQAFFAIVLGIALLAYVIVVINGALQSSTVLSTTTLSTTIINETSFANFSGDFVNSVGAAGFANPVLTAAFNRTIAGGGGSVLANISVSSIGLVTNTTAVTYNNLSISYTYQFNSLSQNQTNLVLDNTSVGVSSFFSAINPVYAILAILVIILVLVVLVRVVTGNTGGLGGQTREPQL